jgi:hypothetical protein
MGIRRPDELEMQLALLPRLGRLPRVEGAMTQDRIDDEDQPSLAEQRWPLSPTHLLRRERWLWWEQLWADVLMLARRYRISPGNNWWEEATQVEALAALAAWVAR